MDESNAPPPSLDLSRYQTAELAETVGQLIAVPRRLRTIGASVAICLLIMWIAVPLLFSQQVQRGTLILLLSYSTVAALAIGMLLGLLLVVNRALDNLVDMFDVSLRITDQAIGDLDDWRDGELHVDTGTLLHSVHDDVLLPVIQKVIHSQSPRLGKLVFPIYRAFFGRITRYVLSRIHERVAGNDAESEGTQVPSTPLAGSLPDAEGQADESPGQEVRDAAGMRDRSQLFLKKAHEFITRRGGQLRSVVIIPLAFLLGVVILLAVLPLLAMLVYLLLT